MLAPSCWIWCSGQFMWSKTNQLIADCDASATMWTYVTISLLPVWIPIARMLIDPEDETKLGTRQQNSLFRVGFAQICGRSRFDSRTLQTFYQKKYGPFMQTWSCPLMWQASIQPTCQNKNKNCTNPPSASVGHRVLFHSVCSVLFCSLKRTFHSFPFFLRVFGDLWDPKEHSVLF